MADPIREYIRQIVRWSPTGEMWPGDVERWRETGAASLMDAPYEIVPSTEQGAVVGTLEDQVDYAWICLYGKVGTGKSTSMAHAAKLGPTVHFDAERRLKAGPLRRMGVPIDRINVITDIRNNMLEAVVNRVRELVHDGGDQATVLVGFDAVDETIKLMVAEVAEIEIAKAKRFAARAGEEYQATREIHRDYWNEMTQRLRDLMRSLRATDVHVMYTSHERRTVDEDDGKVSYGPAATPAVQSDLMAYCDVVGHLTIEHGYHVALFGSGTKYEAKDAFGVLPHKMANPTADRIIGYIDGSLSVASDEVQQRYLERVEASVMELAKAGD